MALTLVESAKLSQNDLQRGVVETFTLESPLLDRLPFIEVEGNAYAYNEEATLPGVEFRAVNAAYSESTGTVNPRTETIVPLGGEADVDRFIQQTRGNLNDQRATQLALKAKSLVRKHQDTLINGDVAVDANSFDGLKKRLTGAQVLDTATNGIPVLGTASADRQTLFDQLDALIAAVPGGADILYLNIAIRAKILSAMRRENQYVEPVGEKREPSYQGIPLADIGQKADGTNIIPITETQGTATDSSSIYAVKFSGSENEPGVGGLRNGDVMVDDLGVLEVKPVYRHRIEFYNGLAVFGRGAARLRGVRNA